MSLLTDVLGYARLAEPVRFRAAWEQAASLRLHDGDPSVLSEYDQHGRIHGGDPEQMLDAAAAAYVPTRSTARTRCSWPPTTRCAANCPGGSATT